MTNRQIIFLEQVKLMEKGVIGRVKVGRRYEPEPIHTLEGWRSLGYKVKKGERAVAAFSIWKHTGKRVNRKTGEEEAGRMILKKAHFFSASQVERRKT